ncbi:MAG: hypothetical protein ACRCX2_13265 [Paraclostridium sp.]
MNVKAGDYVISNTEHVSLEGIVLEVDQFINRLKLKSGTVKLEGKKLINGEFTGWLDTKYFRVAEALEFEF